MLLKQAVVLRPGFGPIAALCLVALQAAAWVHDVSPKLDIQLGEEQAQCFVCNKSYKNHFKLLEKDQNSLLVGARNTVYNISLRDLSEFREQRIEWHSKCSSGKSVDDCQNYIRVVAKIAENRLLVCGTSASKPRCRYYLLKDGAYDLELDGDGRGLCPYDPYHNSTAVYSDGHLYAGTVEDSSGNKSFISRKPHQQLCPYPYHNSTAGNSDGQLYAGTVADFSGNHSVICRIPLTTDSSNLKQLNAPNFVISMAYGSYIFFFFREAAMEYVNCGKAIYSRVGRVCKHDQGDPETFGDH
jgi:semaphorin 6